MAATGTYVLLLHVDDRTSVEVGALGDVELAPGRYVYVGSAFGSGGLRARLRRHLQVKKESPHWHVDYVRQVSRLEGAWVSTANQHLECTWAGAVRERLPVDIPHSGVGASDCDCPAHFYRVSTNCSTEDIGSVLKRGARLYKVDELRCEVTRPGGASAFT
ncbi:hypothetical protein CRI94_03855 [Longibacter salinarum]|uniref:Endonuclease III n=1 Tax=Longibacter salinarum TaxID=1850348 RepID=A0A2A8CZS6_9BACT|nr:GIY-YIG nuclease family protein [Longibacter salinarum]PEN14185.1 hypothetical protein CRI94_03855 [Longibacter salinarum]